MTTLPHAQHTIRRKAYAAHYTPSNIGKFQPEIREIVSGLVGVGVSSIHNSLSFLRGSEGTSFLSLPRNRTHGGSASYPSRASSNSLLTDSPLFINRLLTASPPTPPSRHSRSLGIFLSMSSSRASSATASGALSGGYRFPSHPRFHVDLSSSLRLVLPRPTVGLFLLSLFCHFLRDTDSITNRWAHQVHEEESLSTAISDFPKRGVLVSIFSAFVKLRRLAMLYALFCFFRISRQFLGALYLHSTSFPPFYLCTSIIRSSFASRTTVKLNLLLVLDLPHVIFALLFLDFRSAVDPMPFLASRFPLLRSRTYS